MTEMLVTHSESHPRDLNIIDEVFSDMDVADLEFPAGGLLIEAPDELISALQGREVLFLRPGIVSEEVIANCPDLEIIALGGSGYDNVDIEAATRYGVTVIHTPENPAYSVAEHVIGISLTLLHEFPEKFASDWETARKPTRDLRDCTIGIVGLGFIGYEVARIAREAFDAEVIGYDPYVTGEMESRIYPRFDQSELRALGVDVTTDLVSVCERSDIVTVHTPHTDETDEFIGTEELEAIGDGIFINTSRGGVLDETALVNAIDDDRFTGKAALDVLQSEPPREDDPLLSRPQVFITPHIAGPSIGGTRRAIETTAEKIYTTLDGDVPNTIVNPEVLD